MSWQVIDANGNIKVSNANAVSAGEFVFTTTGNVDDLDFGNASLILANNATLATIRGLKAGSPGQRVTIVSIGAGQVNLSHQDAGDAIAANRLLNLATSLKTPLSAGMGAAIYVYDGITNRWRMTTHEQGVAINYDPMWSSASNPQPVLGNGTLIANYILNGTRVTVTILLTFGSTTTGGTGEWIFTNPGIAVADTNSGVISTDVGTKAYAQMSTGLTTTTFHILDIASNSLVSTTNPFTFDVTDVIAISFESLIS